MQEYAKFQSPKMRISGYNNFIGAVIRGILEFQSPKMRISGYNVGEAAKGIGDGAFQSPKMRISGYNESKKMTHEEGVKRFSPRK